MEVSLNIMSQIKSVKFIGNLICQKHLKREFNFCLDLMLSKMNNESYLVQGTHTHGLALLIFELASKHFLLILRVV